MLHKYIISSSAIDSLGLLNHWNMGFWVSLHVLWVSPYGQVEVSLPLKYALPVFLSVVKCIPVAEQGFSCY